MYTYTRSVQSINRSIVQCTHIYIIAHKNYNSISIQRINRIVRRYLKEICKFINNLKNSCSRFYLKVERAMHNSKVSKHVELGYLKITFESKKNKRSKK